MSLILDPIRAAAAHEAAGYAAAARAQELASMEAERIRRTLSILDVQSDCVDADEGDALMTAIHAGDWDAAGREWAARVQAYCVRCAERQVGVAS